MKTKLVLNKHRCNVPSALSQGSEREALQDFLTDLVACCNQEQARERYIVCDLSSNNMTLQHASYLASWLQEQKIHLYALDMSFNRIYSADWGPVVKLIQALWVSVELIELSGNYLPALLNTPELRVLQETQRVSLALPVCGDGTDSWVQGWTDVAKQFWLKAYGSDYTRSVIAENPAFAALLHAKLDLCFGNCSQEEEEEAELLFKAAELVRASKTDLIR